MTSYKIHFTDSTVCERHVEFMDWDKDCTFKEFHKYCWKTSKQYGLPHWWDKGQCALNNVSHCVKLNARNKSKAKKYILWCVKILEKSLCCSHNFLFNSLFVFLQTSQTIMHADIALFTVLMVQLSRFSLTAEYKMWQGFEWLYYTDLKEDIFSRWVPVLIKHSSGKSILSSNN